MFYDSSLKYSATSCSDGLHIHIFVAFLNNNFPISNKYLITPYLHKHVIFIEVYSQSPSWIMISNRSRHSDQIIVAKLMSKT